MRIMLKFDDVEKFFEGEFSDREPITIGRESDNKAAIPLTVLSRHHARVFAENGVWFVEDLDSANGTFYRGKQLAPGVRTELNDGDIVRFGTVAMSIRFIQPPPAPVAAPAAPQVVEKIVEKRVEVPVEKIVEKVVEKEVLREVQVLRKFDLPKEINGRPVPAFDPGVPGQPFRPGLKMPDDLRPPTTGRKLRI